MRLEIRHMRLWVIRLQMGGFDATIEKVHGPMVSGQAVCGGSSSVAERLTVAQDVVGSIPTRRPINNSFKINYLQISLDKMR